MCLYFCLICKLGTKCIEGWREEKKKKLKFKRSKQRYTGYTHKGGFAKWKENQKKRTHQIKQKATKYLMICLLDGIFPLKCTPSWAYTYTHTHIHIHIQEAAINNEKVRSTLVCPTFCWKTMRQILWAFFVYSRADNVVAFCSLFHVFLTILIHWCIVFCALIHCNLLIVVT